MVAEQYDWDFAEADRLFKREIEIYPNSSWAHHYYAHLLLSVGRTQEGVAETRRALEINPMSWSNFACSGLHDITAGNYKEGEKHCALAISMGASDTYARIFLGWSYELQNRFDEAITEFQKAVVGWGSGGAIFPGSAVFPTAVLGHAYAVAGKESEAREVLNELLTRSKKEYVAAYEIAAIYAGLGDRDRAFEWLQKAYEERANFLPHFRMDPRMWNLQSDPRFQDLLRRMKFPL
jgi:tetratricopeptide (TPR) repeat protein